MTGHTRPTMHSHAVVVGPRRSTKEQGNTPRTHTAQPRGSPPSVVLHAHRSVHDPPQARDGPLRYPRKTHTIRAPILPTPPLHDPLLPLSTHHRSRVRSLSAIALMLFLVLQPLYIAVATDLEGSLSAAAEPLTEVVEVSTPEVVAGVSETEEGDMEEVRSVERDASDGSVEDADRAEGSKKTSDALQADDKTSAKRAEPNDAFSSSEVGSSTGADVIDLEEPSFEEQVAGTSTRAETDPEDVETVAEDTGTTTEVVSETPPSPEPVAHDEKQVADGSDIGRDLDHDDRLPSDDMRAPVADEALAHETEMVRIGDHECTELGDGALYCVERSALAQGDAQFTLSRAEARSGPDGNKEIYFFEHGRAVRITHNTRDDFAPMYDATTDRIVWNALIDDRLQLMLHDRRTGETRQVTDAPYNNSNPQLMGELLVWQAWIDGNWEIMLSREVTRTPMPVTRLTHNTGHDMFPKIFDSLVAWQTNARGVRHVAVYDTQRHQISYVEKRGDGAYENPRFALLFDERQDDGELSVIGYDMETRSEIPLVPIGRSGVPEPVTPRDETGEALPSQSGTSTPIKNGTREGSGDDDDWLPDEDGLHGAHEM
jgi:hypothetical protein